MTARRTFAQRLRDECERAGATIPDDEAVARNEQNGIGVLIADGTGHLVFVSTSDDYDGGQ